MLKNLNSANRNLLVHLFNIFFGHGYSPYHWKSVIVIPILKPGKPADDLNSYRPISLTSCVAKVFERILKFRLQWRLERFEFLPKL